MKQLAAYGARIGVNEYCEEPKKSESGTFTFGI